jgi:hypothetical protein
VLRAGALRVELERAPEGLDRRVAAAHREVSHAKRKVAKRGLVVELQRAMSRGQGFVDPAAVAQHVGEAHLGREQVRIELQCPAVGGCRILERPLAMARAAELDEKPGVGGLELDCPAQERFGAWRVAVRQPQLGLLRERCSRIRLDAQDLLVGAHRLRALARTGEHPGKL